MIDRDKFPKHTALQGMGSQASTWLCEQIERNDMTTYEALYIVQRLFDTVMRLIEHDKREHDDGN